MSATTTTTTATMLKRLKTTKPKPNLGQPKQEHQEEEEEVTQKSVILVSSSDDDEEANEDLSLEIVQKARMREAKRKRNEGFDEFKASEGARSAVVIDLSSASSDEIEVVADRTGGGGARDEAAVLKRNKKKKKKKGKKIEEEEKTVDVEEAEKPVETVEAVAPVSAEAEGVEKVNAIEAVNIAKAEELQTETDGVQDNIIMRKYLRGPRYFDSPDCFLETCYNCNEEGHRAANCTSKKRKKPCFVCGSLDHSAKQCTQGLECYICKKKGHRRKDCPEKHQRISNNCKICLRCGDLGHDMFSCTNDYAPEDLKDIKCYMCEKVGHLCCVNFIDSTPGQVSCYNCGQPGHYGVGCAKGRGETSDTASGTSCFRCGEIGHYARGCPKTRRPKADNVMGESSVPIKTKKLQKETRNKLGSQSAPNNLRKAGKKKMKNAQFEEREFATPKKLKQRGGWITDDPRDVPNRKAKWNSWRSPGTPPTQKNHYYSNQTSGGHFSNSHSPSNWIKPRFHPGTPSPYGQANPCQNRFSASRFGNVTGGGVGTPYHW